MKMETREHSSALSSATDTSLRSTGGGEVDKREKVSANRLRTTETNIPADLLRTDAPEFAGSSRSVDQFGTSLNRSMSLREDMYRESSRTLSSTPPSARKLDSVSELQSSAMTISSPQPAPLAAATTAGLVQADGEIHRLRTSVDEGRTPNGEAYQSVTDNPFLPVTDQPLSTFSIDVDTASYANVRRFLTQKSRFRRRPRCGSRS